MRRDVLAVLLALGDLPKEPDMPTLTETLTSALAMLAAQWDAEQDRQSLVCVCTAHDAPRHDCPACDHDGAAQGRVDGAALLDSHPGLRPIAVAILTGGDNTIYLDEIRARRDGRGIVFSCRTHLGMELVIWPGLAPRAALSGPVLAAVASGHVDGDSRKITVRTPAALAVALEGLALIARAERAQ